MDDRKPAEGRADEVLNRQCFCITLERDVLRAAIRAEAGDADLTDVLLARRPHLFSDTPVFLANRDLTAMLEVVGAIEAAAATPPYQRAVLAWAPQIAHADFGLRGVFMGYDFHPGAAGPRLIEINTTAGGAFLNALLARAQSACCAEAQEALSTVGEGAGVFEGAVWDMFLEEWTLQRGAGRPISIAIVDNQPGEQYLYPEFLLAKALFERRGLDAVVADPAELEYSGGKLLYDGREISLVYNRLIDFALETEGHRALRDANRNGAVVVTPNPRNHALLADKRNLTLLCDGEALDDLRIANHQRQALLRATPKTVLVEAGNADALWMARKRYFFKPVTGHGGKAVYRGDKITRGVWELVASGGYIAQEIAPPSERRIRVDGQEQSLKLDMRLYTYRGEPLLSAARIYQGQTTNFRTPGGGFAPVYAV